MDPFLGEIRPVPYNFAPLGWAFCAGQILPIAQNTALFALLGTTYGGNGVSTFGLPDLRGRVPVGAGQGPGLPNVDLGEVSGSENVSLTAAQIPAHSHAVNVSAAAATAYGPDGHIPATSARSIYGPATANALAADTVAQAGGGQPHENRQPYTCISYIIAMQGIFPSR